MKIIGKISFLFCFHDLFNVIYRLDHVLPATLLDIKHHHRLAIFPGKSGRFFFLKSNFGNVS